MKKSSNLLNSSSMFGIDDRRRIRETMTVQSLVSNDPQLADELIGAGKTFKVPSGRAIIRQGDSGNDIFFLLSGSVSIRCNNREIATRGAGCHVGELALIDPLSTRSATVIAREKVVVHQVDESRFSAIASRRPELWRRIASEVANRLRQRNRFLVAPNSEPIAFIGSSSEGLRVANEVHRQLKYKRLIPRIWSDGVFQASKTTIETLVNEIGHSDFAILVLSPDDITESRKNSKCSPRDNVIFELGLFIGALGRERVFMLKTKNRDLKVPTDLLGVTCLPYSPTGPGTLSDRLRKQVNEIGKAILNMGPR